MSSFESLSSSDKKHENFTILEVAEEEELIKSETPYTLSKDKKTSSGENTLN